MTLKQRFWDEYAVFRDENGFKKPFVPCAVVALTMPKEGGIGLLCHHFDSPIVETYRQPAFEFVDVGGGYIFLAFDDGNYHIVLLVLVVHGAAVAEGDISNLRVLYAYLGSNLRGGNVFAMVDVQLFLECGDDAVFLSLYFVLSRERVGDEFFAVGRQIVAGSISVDNQLASLDVELFGHGEDGFAFRGVGSVSGYI